MKSPSSIPKKRPPRNRGPEREQYADADIAAMLADFAALYEVCRDLPHWTPGEPGRPPAYPPELLVLFGAMCCGSWKFKRAVERQFKHRPTWEAVRRALYRRFPQYYGLRPGAKAPTRHHFRYCREAYGISDEHIVALHDAFVREAVCQGLAMGMFDPANVSFTHPDPRNCVAGDCTVIPSRFNAGPGTMQYDPDTGEVTEKLYDPDAEHYTVYDEFGNSTKETVYGTKFGFMQARLPGQDHEFLVLDVYHVTSGDDHEALAAERSVAAIQRHAPGVTALVYDMALHGVNREHLYDQGLLLVTKCPQIRQGQPRSRSLGLFGVNLTDGTTEQVEIWAINGAPHLPVIVSGQRDFVRLERGPIQPRPKVNGSRNARWTPEPLLLRVPAAG